MDKGHLHKWTERQPRGSAWKGELELDLSVGRSREKERGQATIEPVDEPSFPKQVTKPTSTWVLQDTSGLYLCAKW